MVRMTPHPTHRLSRAATEAFERIAICQPHRASSRTLRALLDRRLIVQTGTKILGRDRFGVIAVPVYEVPLAVHYQWCCWADENVTDEELDEMIEAAP
jgi:hypothetical protein